VELRQFALGPRPGGRGGSGQVLCFGGFAPHPFQLALELFHALL
jgi:hypothetical protein